MEDLYLTPQQLADRYGISIHTVTKWRTRTRDGDLCGPEWEELPQRHFDPHAPRIRYKLTDVLSWEARLDIHPKTTPETNG